VSYGEVLVGETIDLNGRRVVLFAGTWHEKILDGHPEMLPFSDAVLNTVATASHVEADSRYPARMRYFSHGVGPSRWLLVVVSYEQLPARIVTAFARRKDPLSWSPSV
jgi:hypothetical protein